MVSAKHVTQSIYIYSLYTYISICIYIYVSLYIYVYILYMSIYYICLYTICCPGPDFSLISMLKK